MSKKRSGLLGHVVNWFSFFVAFLSIAVGAYYANGGELKEMAAIVGLVLAGLVVFIRRFVGERRLQELTEKIESLDGKKWLSKDNEHHLGRLIDKIGRLSTVSWEFDQNVYLDNVYSSMNMMLDREGVTGFDVITLLNDLNPSQESHARLAYYNAVERRLDAGGFTYRRVLINRGETIGYHMLVREALKKHLLASLDQKAPSFVDFRTVAGGERLIDVAFAISYLGGKERYPHEMVVEIEAWSEVKQRRVFGLLKLAGGESPMAEFRKIFDGLISRTDQDRYLLDKKSIEGAVKAAETDRKSSVEDLIKKRNQEFSLGYSDIFDSRKYSNGRRSERCGGGKIFWGSAGREGIRHLHIIPHGGTVFDQAVGDFQLESFVGERIKESSTRARAILQEYDAGTPRLAQLLLDKIHRGEQSDGVDWSQGALAFFNVPRAFVDANRFRRLVRLPKPLPSGFSILEDEFERDQGHSEALMESSGAWIEGVERLIQEARPSIVVHHHTYDAFGEDDQEYDLAAFTQRPPAQIFAKNGWFEAKDNVLVATPEILGIASNVLSAGIGKMFTGFSVGRDQPLKLPEIPFVPRPASDDGDGGGDEDRTLEGIDHVIYEIRKDLVVGKFPEDYWMPMVQQLIQKTLEAASEPDGGEAGAEE